MLVSGADFSAFPKANGAKCPHNQVFKTRRRFDVKWLVTNKPTCADIPGNEGTHTALPSSCLYDDVVQYLIVTKDAMPVPPEMLEILDWMHCWGRGPDVNWCAKVVDWLHLLLVSKIHLTNRMVPLRDCVEFRVRHMLREMGLERNPFLWGNMVHSWHQFFETQCDAGNTSFYDLAVASVQFVQWTAQEQNWIATPTIMSTP